MNFHFNYFFNAYITETTFCTYLNYNTNTHTNHAKTYYTADSWELECSLSISSVSIWRFLPQVLWRNPSIPVTLPGMESWKEPMFLLHLKHLAKTSSGGVLAFLKAHRLWIQLRSHLVVMTSPTLIGSWQVRQVPDFLLKIVGCWHPPFPSLLEHWK